MLQAALDHAARGRPVFPCGANKRPLVKTGFKAATTDEAQIRAWWTQWPNAMIGMPTGRCAKVWVLDVDQHGMDGEDSLRKLAAGRVLPETVEALTPSGGRHIYFRLPEGVEIRNSAGKLGSGLDVRGEGGYVILPPSRANGHCYEWEGSSDPGEGIRAAEAPPWLLVLVSAPPKSEAPTDPIIDALMAKGLYRESRRDGRHRIICPWWQEHTGGDQTGTAYMEAHHNGHDHPSFVCQHSHCGDRHLRDLLHYLGLDGNRTSKTADPPGSGVQDLSEDTLALRFAKEHPYLRYVERFGNWLRWDGIRWAPDSTGHTFEDVRVMLRRVNVPDDKRRGLLSAKSVAGVERLAQVDRRLAATVDQWDANDWILNTPDGIVDLRASQCRAHDPAAYCTKITAANARGECPAWRAFLAEITDRDSSLADFLKRVSGYALTGSTREHALFFFYGTGANGKGVFLNTLYGVLGDYSRIAAMESFTETHSDRHPTDLAGLQGARLVVAQETEEGRRWAESRIKSLTGGDPISARFMRQDFFTFVPKFKLLIAGNHKPRLRNVDEAIRRRLHLIPFTVTIPPERRDRDLAEKLKAEWPGILQWAVDGCREYLSHGLCPPEAVRTATEQYFGAQDLFAEWIEDCLEKGSQYWEPTSRLFADWKRFCEHANARPSSRAELADRLAAAGFEAGNSRAKGGRHWNGLQLRHVEEPSGWAGT